MEKSVEDLRRELLLAKIETEKQRGRHIKLIADEAELNLAEQIEYVVTEQNVAGCH
jgi:hypothetical protein